jgi:peroxiredoxin
MPKRSVPTKLAEAFQRLREMDGTLSEQLSQVAEAGRRREPEMAAAVERLVERLRENHAGEHAPKIGEPMPDFVMPDDAGRLVSLASLIKDGPVALTFHRGHWCPFCRISINALAKAQLEIAAEGGQIVVIVPERGAFSTDLKSAARAEFPILTDVDNGYALSLNLAIWLGEEMRKILAGRGNLLPDFQGNEAWMVPIPGTFVVGRDGLVKARFVDPDYRKRMAIEDLLAALRSAG